jgi:hypothetical protein
VWGRSARMQWVRRAESGGDGGGAGMAPRRGAEGAESRPGLFTVLLSAVLFLFLILRERMGSGWEGLICWSRPGGGEIGLYMPWPQSSRMQ